MVTKKRLVELSERMEYKDLVRGSNPDYPYEERGFAIHGMSAASSEIERSIKKHEESLKHFQEIKRKIECLRERTDDPVDKLIIEYTMCGDSQMSVAEKIGISQSKVSRRLSEMIEKL